MAQTALNPQPEEITILRASRGWAALRLRDLWLYRELVYFLTWRDLKVRYKQTALGAAWAIIQPVLTMVVFSVFFGGLLRVSSEGVPYPIFSYTALLPWGIFSKSLSDAGRSLVMNRNMITKVYFPRLVIPLSSVLASVVDFLIAFAVLVMLIVYFHVTGQFHFQLSPALLALPLLLILALATALGIGLWLSALNVVYRDVGYVLPFLTQLWFYVTPIVYPSSKVPEAWRVLYGINPMVAVVEGFRWALLGIPTAGGPMIAVSVCVALLMLFSGLFYFRRMERTFADAI